MQYKAKDLYKLDPFTHQDPFSDGNSDAELAANSLHRRMHLYSAKNIDKVTTVEEARRRAEGYLNWIGATWNEVLYQWDFDGDIVCEPENFLIFDGELTVQFGDIKGYFVCDDVGLISTVGLPTYCNELHIIHANLGDLNWLPSANVYNLRNCGITSIANEQFSEHAYHIEISHNKLAHLPDMTNLNLQEFDCSHNLLQTLQGAPVADKFRADSCNIREFTEDGSTLFENIIEMMSLSNNDLRSLKGIPPVRVLDISSNYDLHSFMGIEKACRINEGVHEYRDSFREIDASHTGISKLDFLPKAVYKLNMDRTNLWNLKSNTCDSIWTLYAHSCQSLKTGSLGSEMHVADMYIDDNCTCIKTLAGFRDNVHKIEFRTADHGQKMERDFFNMMNREHSDESAKETYKYEDEQDYYDKFLRFLGVEHDFLPDDIEKAKEMFYWPDWFIGRVEGLIRSKKPMARYKL